MKVKEVQSHPQFREKVYIASSSSGTEIALIPTPGFQTSSAHFGLRFGGNDLFFEAPEGEKIKVPTGSAHYLEHKLFEGREEKVFDRFGRLGASFNGGTSFTTTTYYFSTSNHFDESLEVLLDFVQYPLITEERVDKERGIINQEVQMYLDNPGYYGTFLLHEAMYENHSIRIGPGGTLEDVDRICAQDLQSCYDSFYVPSAMKLSLAGDFLVDDMLEKISPLLRISEDVQAKSLSQDFNSKRTNTFLEREFSVTRPHVWMGFAYDQGELNGLLRLKSKLIHNLMIEMLFGKSSTLRQHLYDDGVIDDSFSAYWSSDKTWGHAVLAGICDQPHSFIDTLREKMAGFLNNSMESADFERLKRAAWGATVSSLQSPSSLASVALNNLLNETSMFDAINILQELKFDEVLEAGENTFLNRDCAVAILNPKT